GRDVSETRQQDWSAGIVGRISAFDLTFVLMAIGVWLVPYIAGGQASTYRSEAFVVVCVPLLRRLPAWLLVVPVGAAGWVAWNMAPSFFKGKLQGAHAPDSRTRRAGRARVRACRDTPLVTDSLG